MVVARRVLVVDKEWTHHRLIASTIRERFPDVAVYSTASVARACDQLSSIRFDLVLVEAGLAGAQEDLMGPTGAAASAPIAVFDIAPGHGGRALSPHIACITELVERHLKG